MTAALSEDRRSVLEELTQTARRKVEDDFEATLAGKFGIHRSGRLAPATDLSLSATERAIHANLVEVVQFLRAEGATDAASVDRLIREAAFTLVNRLVAVRIAESQTVAVLPETMAEGLSSSGFAEFEQLAPLVAATQWGRFGFFIRLCADELSGDVPALFDPRNPLLELELSEPVLAEVVEAIAAVGNEVWGAPDALGWAYQFFNTDIERKAMHDASAAPRTSRELAVRNQFFTPSYVVEFLVHNGLGAYLAAGIDGLAEQLTYLVPGNEPGAGVGASGEHPAIDLDAVSVLDPACGSGHFLLGAYDVLEKAHKLNGLEPADAAPRIVASLWGIDIDPRAAQIASAAVIFRARRAGHSGPLPTPNVICVRALPTGAAIDAIVADLAPPVQRAVRGLAKELVNAPLLGSLLKIEERIEDEALDRFGTGKIAGTLAEEPEVEMALVHRQVLAAVDAMAAATTATAAERLFAAEAHDAVRFVAAMTRRYTAVVMNPPFGSPVPESKPYLKANYSWIPTGCELAGAFVGRGLELAEPVVGSCAAITTRAALFLKGHQRWRSEVLHASDLRVLGDLGNGVMEQATVESAAYVVGRRPPGGDATFIRLTRDLNRAQALLAVADRLRRGDSDERVFRRGAAFFQAIPTAPLAYWAAPSLTAAFSELKALGQVDDVVNGLSTGDNFRFVRLFWEVEPDRIGYCAADVAVGNRWVPLAKGGAYSPYWADLHLVVDWSGNGDLLKNHPSSRVQNVGFYFDPGLTWTMRTNSAFSPRLLPRGCIPGAKGNLVRTEAAFSRLTLLTSRFARESINLRMSAGDETTSGGAAREYTTGVVGTVPVAELPGSALAAAERLAARCRAHDTANEVTSSFISPACPLARPDHLAQLADGQLVDDLVSEAVGLDENGVAYLNNEGGLHPLRFAETTRQDDRIADLFTLPMKELIRVLKIERGAKRQITTMTYLADRRLEVISHGLEISPASIMRVVKERGLVAPGEADDAAFRLVSYLVGVAFGRWDVRIGADPSRAQLPDDLLTPPARYSPGSLVDASNWPPQTPPGYPLEFPASGLLIDEPGQQWDFTTQVQAAARALSGSEDDLDAALAQLANPSSLAEFLRRHFFKQHLTMYSMSRRQAPIYWPLQVPSQQWGVWLYMPRLSRNSLFAVGQEAQRRSQLADRQIEHLQKETATGRGGRPAATVANDLDREQNLALELKAFRAEANRIANLGWEPNMDDGAVLNAAPLADLLPAWPQAASYRKALREKKYQWATVAQYAAQL